VRGGVLDQVGRWFKKFPLGKPDRLIEVAEGCTPYGFARPSEYSTMYHELLRDATFWAFLFTIDQDLAEARRKDGSGSKGSGLACSVCECQYQFL